MDEHLCVKESIVRGRTRELARNILFYIKWTLEEENNPRVSAVQGHARQATQNDMPVMRRGIQNGN